ncbi:Deoxycytidine triphosphate deaminase [compost metagenome]
MSLKSDGWIAHQCTRPTHRLHPHANPERFRLISPPYSEYQKQAIENWCPANGHERFMRKDFAMPVTEEELANWNPMIEGFCERPVRYVDKLSGEPVYIDLAPEDEVPGHLRKVISYGTSSYGYDVRLAGNIEHIKVFTNVVEPEIDPKRMKATNFGTPRIETDVDGARYVMIPPHSYLQGPTVEYFRIPRDVLVIVLGKSTYARSALICNVTPIEPEFEGEVVIEVANTTNSPVRCYLDEGIAQFVFFQGDEACLRSYKDKLGKYMGQRGLQFAKV